MPLIAALRWVQARLLDAFSSAPSYNDAASNADFALVTLASPVGNTTGWLGLEVRTEVVDLTTTSEKSTRLDQSVGHQKFQTHWNSGLVHRTSRLFQMDWFNRFSFSSGALFQTTGTDTSRTGKFQNDSKATYPT